MRYRPTQAPHLRLIIEAIFFQHMVAALSIMPYIAPIQERKISVVENRFGEMKVRMPEDRSAVDWMERNP
jgi:hypothetical protein